MTVKEISLVNVHIPEKTKFRTPENGDCLECPCCGFINSVFIGADIIYEDGSKIELNMCSNCKVLFDSGHIWSYNGHTSNIYHAKFISKYEYMGTEYIGMPRLDSWESFKLSIMAGDFLIKETRCTCEGEASDSKALYPESEHPEYYQPCPQTETYDKPVTISILE
jgi:hypothetical protein